MTFHTEAMSDKDKTDVIIEEVCSYFRVEPEQIKTRRRHRETTVPRQFAMYYLRNYSALSQSDIGHLFNRDHASVSHSIRMVRDLIQYNGYITTDLKLNLKITNRLQSEAVVSDSWVRSMGTMITNYNRPTE